MRLLITIALPFVRNEIIVMIEMYIKRPDSERLISKDYKLMSTY